jgi:hypothetical protein
VSAVVHSRSGYCPFNVRYHSTACVSSPPLYTTFRPPSLCSLHSFFGPCHLLVARRSSLPPSLDAPTFLSLLPTLNRPPCLPVFLLVRLPLVACIVVIVVRLFNHLY